MFASSSPLLSTSAVRLECFPAQIFALLIAYSDIGISGPEGWYALTAEHVKTLGGAEFLKSRSSASVVAFLELF